MTSSTNYSKQSNKFYNYREGSYQDNQSETIPSSHIKLISYSITPNGSEYSFINQKTGKEYSFSGNDKGNFEIAKEATGFGSVIAFQHQKITQSKVETRIRFIDSPDIEFCKVEDTGSKDYFIMGVQHFIDIITEVFPDNVYSA
jgi:predicted ATPase